MHDESTDQAAYLRKALAAGRSIDEIDAFEGRIRGQSPTWLRENLRLTARSTGTGAQQRFELPCGATTLQAIQAELDPIHALEVRDEAARRGAGGARRPAGDKLDELSPITGLAFQMQRVGEHLTVSQAMAIIDASLAQGAPVPIVLGQSSSEAARRALVTGVAGGQERSYTIHDPWEGKTVTRTADQMQTGNLDIAGYTHLTGIEKPTVL